VWNLLAQALDDQTGRVTAETSQTKTAQTTAKGYTKATAARSGSGSEKEPLMAESSGNSDDEANNFEARPGGAASGADQLSVVFLVEDLARLWSEDAFPIFGLEFKFTTVVSVWTAAVAVLLAIVCRAGAGVGKRAPPSSAALSLSITEIGAIRAEMRKIYQVYKPEKLVEVDEIIELFKGRENLILPELRKKYKVV
jgi:hypothetical protein